MPYLHDHDHELELDTAAAERRRSYAPAPGKRTLTMSLAPRPAELPGLVQRRVRFGGSEPGADELDAAARRGVATATSALPYRDAVQAAFGRHRIDQVQVHDGAEAAATAAEIDAEAYAVGDHIVLGGMPTLHTVAHEAAHVVQQRAGVARKGGGDHDRFEHHADAVADAVAAGRSAEALLDELAPGGGEAGHVQRKISFNGQKQFADLPALRAAVHALYADGLHDEINEVIDETDGASFSIGAVKAFEEIKKIGVKRSWARAAASEAKESSSGSHGPQLPRLNTTGTADDAQGAMSAFTYPSVTIARVDLILPDGKTVSFEGRQESGKKGKKSGPKDHAEDVVRKQVDDYLAAAKIAPGKCRVRLTINNLPCHEGPGEQGCSTKVRDWGKAFAGFHLYFTNKYGEDPQASIENMQGAGLAVSHFAPGEALEAMEDAVDGSRPIKPETREKVDAMKGDSPEGADLDPWSDEDTDAMGDAKKRGDKSKGKRKKQAAAEPESKSKSKPEPEPEPEAKSKAKGGGKKKVKGAATVVEDLPGELRNVSGRGLNCLIRALMTAGHMPFTRESIDAQRTQLIEAGVADEDMLELRSAAGAILLSQIVPGRGVEVYLPHPDGYSIDRVVDGPHPVRLYLADGHFQAIV